MNVVQADKGVGDQGMLFCSFEVHDIICVTEIWSRVAYILQTWGTFAVDQDQEGCAKTDLTSQIGLSYENTWWWKTLEAGQEAPSTLWVW